MLRMNMIFFFFFFFQAEDGIRDLYVTGVQTCALPISGSYASIQPVRRCCTPNGSKSWRDSEHCLETPERSEERRVGKSVDLGGRRIIKKKKRIKKGASISAQQR